ncbi:MAG TPA: hypothetical protein VHC91_18220 [Trinickia sp.]|uniref:hypothetical protein n=1 Tax=Trinickia sp. TaxID=2571163 RepID=UPI002CBD57AD|nr:hypothetical protein [Trinickia sp.]HVW52293.1 hypothetical protein [Trinickia sp.]
MADIHSEGRARNGNGASVARAGWAVQPAARNERRRGGPPESGRMAALRIGAFFAATWLAAAVLYFGRHSVALIVVSGVVALGGLDVMRPE